MPTDVATNLLKAAIASGQHEITIFTRSVPKQRLSGVTYEQVDYTDRAKLIELLRGTDVCLSFIIPHFDTDNIGQKNLIHACIEVGVRRFAPSEWGMKSDSGIDSYASKDTVAEYLRTLDEQGKLGGLEYCLFQPSIFADYFAHPYPMATDLITWPFFIDMDNRRAIVLEEAGHIPIVLTSVHDDAQILNKALSDPRPWPKLGGIRGCRTTLAELLEVGKKIRGGNWTVENVKAEDILRNELKTSWVPSMTHPAIPEGVREQYSSKFICDFLGSAMRGKWDVSDEWNQRFPDYKFTSAEEYLTKVWEGRP